MELSDNLHTFSGGQYIFLQGDKVDCIYVLVEGTIEVIACDEKLAPFDEEKVAVNGCLVNTIRAAGSMVGEMGSIMKKRTASLRIAGDRAVLQRIPIDEKGFQKAVIMRPSLGLTCATTLCRRIRETNPLAGGLMELENRILDLVDEASIALADVVDRCAGELAGEPALEQPLARARLSGTYRHGLACRLKKRVDITKRFKQQGVIANVMELRQMEGAAGNLIREYDRDQIVVREGEEGDEFYIVLSGQLQVMLGRKRLQILQQGEIFGEVAVLLGETKRTASVVTTSRSRLLCVPAGRFEELMKRHPFILLHVVKMLSGRLKATNETLTRTIEITSLELDRLCQGKGSVRSQILAFVESLGPFEGRVRTEIQKLKALLERIREQHFATVAELQKMRGMAVAGSVSDRSLGGPEGGGAPLDGSSSSNRDDA